MNIRERIHNWFLRNYYDGYRRNLLWMLIALIAILVMSIQLDKIIVKLDNPTKEEVVSEKTDSDFTGLDPIPDSTEGNYCVEVERRLKEEKFFIEVAGNEEGYYADRGLSVVDYIHGIITDGNQLYYYPVVVRDRICWSDTNGNVHVGIASLGDVGERTTLHSPSELSPYFEDECRSLECNLDYEVVVYENKLYLYRLGKMICSFDSADTFVGISPDKEYVFLKQEELIEIRVCKSEDDYFFLEQPFNKEGGAK